MDAPVVFLHIPKTAGQTVHAALEGIVGLESVSPIRVHTQVAPGEAQMPAGYSVYSGHLDWTELDTLPPGRFVFTVLRDPRERIASFYLYLRGQAEVLSPEALEQPHNIGLARVLSVEADEYFFGGDASWQRFIHDHYDNFYCSYFATRQMRGWGSVKDLPRTALLAQARCGLAALDGRYMTTNLRALERDLRRRYAVRTNLIRTFDNSLDLPRWKARWPILTARLDSAARDRLEAFTALDFELIRQSGLSE